MFHVLIVMPKIRLLRAMKCKTLLVAIAIFLSSCIKDDRKWVETKFPNVNLQSILWANNQFVAGGLDKTKNFISLTSSDGVSWIKHPTLIPCNYVNMSWLNNQYVVYCASNINNLVSLLISIDGVSWVQIIPMVIMGNMAAITWDGTKYITGNDSPGILSYSYDLVNWSTIITDKKSEIFLTVYFVNSKYFAHVGNIKTDITNIYRSNDGINWQNIPLLQGVGESGILFDGTEYILFGNNGGIYTSPDGENWTDHSVFMGPIFDHAAHSVSKDYIFIPRVNARSSMEIWSTPDFWSWKQYIYRQEVSHLDLQDYDRFMGGVATNGSVYVVVGYEGKNWTQSGGGYTGVILTSP